MQYLYSSFSENPEEVVGTMVCDVADRYRYGHCGIPDRDQHRVCSSLQIPRPQKVYPYNAV